MNPDVVSRFSGIGRPLDFDYSGNRIIAFLSAAVFISGSILQWIGTQGGGEALVWGLKAATAVFFSWASGRELNPDYPPAAIVGAGLTAVGIWIWGLAALGLLLWLLIGMRILNRTTGLRPKWVDLGGLTGLGVWLSSQGHWEAGLLTIMLLIINRILPGGQKMNWIFATVSAAGMTILFLMDGKMWPIGSFNWLAVGAALIGAVLFLPVIIQAGSIRSRGDKTGEHLEAIRVQAGQIFAAVFWLLHTGMEGPRGLFSLFPIYAAGLGSGLYWTFVVGIEHFRKSGPE